MSSLIQRQARESSAASPAEHERTTTPLSIGNISRSSRPDGDAFHRRRLALTSDGMAIAMPGRKLKIAVARHLRFFLGSERASEQRRAPST